MTYDDAMALIHRNGKRTVARGGMKIGWRFGRPVVLSEGNRFIDYTPTRDDMHASDWDEADTEIERRFGQWKRATGYTPDEAADRLQEFGRWMSEEHGWNEMMALLALAAATRDGAAA